MPRRGLFGPVIRYEGQAAQGIPFSPLSYMSESAADEKPFDSVNNDDKELLALGYKPSFKREFTNLATVSLPKCKSLETSDDLFPL